MPNCRENQVNGDSTRTKKLKLQYKVAAKVPIRRVQSVKVMLHEAIFLTTCNATNVALQVVRKKFMCDTPFLQLQLFRCELQEK